MEPFVFPYTVNFLVVRYGIDFSLSNTFLHVLRTFVSVILLQNLHSRPRSCRPITGLRILYPRRSPIFTFRQIRAIQRHCTISQDPWSLRVSRDRNLEFRAGLCASLRSAFTNQSMLIRLVNRKWEMGDILGFLIACQLGSKSREVALNCDG